MVKKAAILMGFCAAMVSVDAAAGPPMVRPIDIPTLYGLAEGARYVDRETQPRKASDQPLKTRTIVIDPGHGGDNDGAVGVASIEEKHLTLELAYAVRDALEERHPEVRVLLTRYWDREVDLYERTRWANEIGADLFLSLHYNAATHNRAVGYETYFLTETKLQDATFEPRHQKGTKVQRRAWRAMDRARSEATTAARVPLREPHQKSKVLAAQVQQELAGRLTTPDRGVKQANFAVLRGALMPAIVVESGFLTHPEEGVDVLTAEHRQKIVEALVTAIETFDAASEAQQTVDPSEPIAQR
jgi:N-acetylmuramoyl-L-alanine amidase